MTALSWQVCAIGTASSVGLITRVVASHDSSAATELLAISIPRCERAGSLLCFQMATERLGTLPRVGRQRLTAERCWNGAPSWRTRSRARVTFPNCFWPACSPDALADLMTSKIFEEFVATEIRGIMEDQVRSDLTNFIVSNYLFGDETKTPAEDDMLVDDGVIDSTGILELIEFLESHFGISVAEVETVPENLGSIARLVRFVVAKSVAVPAA